MAVERQPDSDKRRRLLRESATAAQGYDAELASRPHMNDGRISAGNLTLLRTAGI